MFRRNGGLLAGGSRCRGSIGAVLGMGIHMRDKAKRQESIEYVRVTVDCSSQQVDLRSKDVGWWKPYHKTTLPRVWTLSCR